MADSYRYPLTRICLRTGSLTLPLSLLGVFPERGEVVAFDPQKDVEFTLRVEGRRVLGLAPFFDAHEVTVNDELTIRPLEDGRYAFTAVVRPRRPDFTRPEVIGRLLDDVVEAGVPVSEAEIRELHPELPSGFPLRQALERESRLMLREGRWQRRLPERVEPAAAPERVAEAETAVVAAQVAKAEDERAAPRPVDVPRAEAGATAAAAAPMRHERTRHEVTPTPPAPAAPPATAGGGESSDRAEAARARVERWRAEREKADRERAEREQQARAETADAAPEAEALPVGVAGRADRAEPDEAEPDEAARARAEVEAALEAEAAREAEIMALVEQDELEAAIRSASGESGADLEEARRRSRERLAAHAEDDALAAARRQRDERADRRRGDREGEGAPESFSWDQPLARRLRLPWLRRREEPKETVAEMPVSEDPLKLDRLGEPKPVGRSAPPAPRVSPAPRAGLFATDAGLNSATLPPGDPAKTKRAREAFTTLGYRVEGLAHGQLMLHVDFGRRFARILVHVLPDEQRLDWAALLARRRESGATHLAVVGDHRDLHRLVAPADLAKATLWSWAAIARVVELAGSMPIGPFDLDPHFERDGLFEYGLDRFERTVAKRVQERGTFSAVLERLALMKPPAVFMLEDVVAGSDLPREQALRVLERLCDAPWHLVSRVDSGEFCVRYRVHDALDQLGAYATSLRVRLPERHRERVRGLPDDVDPIAATDLAGDGGSVPVAEEPEAATSGAPASTSGEAGAPADDRQADAPAARRTPAHPAEADAPATGTGPAARGAAAGRGGEQGRLMDETPRPFAGPGLGPEDEPDPDEVDLSLVAVKRRRRRR